MRSQIFSLPIGILLIIVSLVGCYIWIGNVAILAISIFCFGTMGTKILSGKIGGTNKGMALVSIVVPAFIYMIPENTDFALIGERSIMNVLGLTILLIIMGWFSYNFMNYQFSRRKKVV